MDDDCDASDVEAVERERQRALIAADIPALDRILAHDLIHVHSSGMVHDKGGFLRHIARMGGFVAIEREPPRIDVDGDFARLTGPAVNRLRSPETGEEVTVHAFVTQILRKGPHGWQITLSQTTPIRGVPGPARTGTDRA